MALAILGSAGISAVGSYLGGEAQKDASEAAAAAQVESARLGTEETRRQFDLMQKTLQPYVGAGETALTAQMNLVGLGGEEAQQAAITNISQSPLFQQQAQQGEEAILQQASATGGVRGGNIQGILAQYRPQMLQQEIANQYGRLGGITGIGQASAAGVGAGALQTGANIANLQQQAGAAIAGGHLAQGQATAQQYAGMASSVAQPLSTLGTLSYMKQLGAF